MGGRVLIVDDDATSLSILETALRERGHDVMTRTQAIGTTTVILRERPAVVVLDVDMPAINGDRIVSMIHEKVPAVDFVLCSGLPEGEVHRLAMECGAIAGVAKGDLSALVMLVESSLAKHA